ncbi:helix-turn-helix domain-containing protein [Aliiglaciecola sp. LCG003]|uniref:helix-turn-helix domain-containing protein n=1 Tax=Aliiglaciecola sp. LCG003 TaxID=3053655 RepID=UPI0025722F68|nr:helix-turn-helix domain-containing protein [Aliiglaciecola sp. LCG003]WJG08068.1 helix-turn-helix domain-containing protein [Aliiglaciecola sp. LCG003]
MSRRKKFEGTVLRELRKKSGFTQEEWAQKVGLSRETISAIENNKPGTIEHLSMEVMRKMYEISSSRIDDAHKHSFMEKVICYFGF